MKNLIKHSLAVEAIMKDLAFYFKEDIDKWVWQDCSMTLTAKKRRAIFQSTAWWGAEILESLDIESSIIYAVKAHNDLSWY